jgi:hypothetical protein
VPSVTFNSQSFLCTVCFVCVCSACSTDGIVRPYIEISIRLQPRLINLMDFTNLWKFQFLQMYYPKVFCVCLFVCVSVRLIFCSVRIWTESVQTRRLRLGLPSVTFNINLMEISIPSDVLPKVFCVFVCLLSVSFFLFRTDGRSPSTKIFRLCHRSRLILPLNVFCVWLVCVFVRLIFFLCSVRTDGVRPVRTFIYQIVPRHAYSHL